jgi:hypothetical protein
VLAVKRAGHYSHTIRCAVLQILRQNSPRQQLPDLELQASYEACAGIDSGMDSCMASGGGGFRRMLEPHEDPCAVDYVCLLSKDWDEYPQTGHIVPEHIGSVENGV